MSDYEFYGQLVFYIVFIVWAWVKIRKGINKYVYNCDYYDYPDYTEN